MGIGGGGSGDVRMEVVKRNRIKKGATINDELALKSSNTYL